MQTLQIETGSVLLRPARPDDAGGIAALDYALALAKRGMVLTPDQVGDVGKARQRLEDAQRRHARGDRSLGLVAELDGRIVGSANLSQLAPAMCRHVGVLSLGVSPSVHRRGIGRALMLRLVDHARETGFVRLELCVRADNDAARALYRGIGFHDEAVRRRFIRELDGTFVDDVLMAMFLD